MWILRGMMMRFRGWSLLVWAVLLMICGCGGGSGGDGGGAVGPGSGLELGSTSVSFTASSYGPAPATQYVDVEISASNAYYIIVGYPPGSTIPSWLDLDLAGSDSSWRLVINITSTALAVDTYRATVRVLCADSNENVIAYRDLSVQYILTNDLSAGPTNINFTHVSGCSSIPAGQTVNIGGTGIHWSATADKSWVALSNSNGTAPSTLTVGVDPSGMAQGTYTATVTISDGTDSIDLGVTLSVAAPSFSVAPDTIILGGSDGMNFDAQSLQFSLSTGSNAYPWSATLNADSGSWLLADSTAGVVSSTAVTINVDCNRTGLSSGSYNGTIALNSIVNGNPITASVPVILNIEAHRLFVAENGVALASMPGLGTLTRTVEVRDTYGWATTHWSASSDQAWLSVTPNGLTGDDLTLTADPAGLSSDTVHFATVSISSADAGIENTETIQVGLWVGASDPTSLVSIDTTYSELVADAIRPFVYVHNGGPDIDIYNVHTGLLEGTIPNVAVQLGPMTASSDGARLFAADLTNARIVPVDLQTRTVGAAWDLADSPTVVRLAFARPKGFGVVLASDGFAYEAENGTRLSETFTPNGNIAVNSDGSRFFVQSGHGSPARLYGYAMDYSALAARGLIIEYKNERSDAGPGADLAVSADGLRLYTACGAPYVFTFYDAETLSQLGTLPADAYPNNIQVGGNGNIYGGANSWYGPIDIWVYDSVHNALTSDYLSGYAEGILSRQLTVSGDGLRIIVLTSDPSLKFVTGP